MKTARRDRRKPEMQIYRPRMGLQNKNSQIEESSVGSDIKHTSVHPKNASLTHDHISDQFNSPEVHANEVDKIGSQSRDISKSSKNTKNRRPDIQVYTPKPKLVAQSNEKKTESVKSTLQVSLKDDDTQAKSISKKPPHLPFKDNSDVKAVKTQSSSKEIQSKSSIQNSSVKYFDLNSPLRIGSWADLMGDYDLTISRSIPDDRLCNDHIENTNIHSPPKENDKNQRRHNRSSKQKSNKDDSDKRHRVRQNSHQSENNYLTERELGYDFSHKEIDNEQKHSTSNDNRFNSLPWYEDEEKRTKYKKREILKEQRNSIGVPDLIERVKIVNLQNEIQQGRNSLIEDKDKIDKKKRCDPPIPPRFQKNKSQNHEILCVSPTKYDSSHGDLLKLPANFIQNINYIPLPQPAFIKPSYKCFELPVNNVPSNCLSIEYCTMDSSLKFSPNRSMGYIPPPQPAVMNIPYKLSEIPVNGVPDSSMSLKYFSLDSSCIASPNPSMGYIAPPHPAVKNPAYMHLGIPVNIVSDSSFKMREAIAPPVQCPTIRDMHLNTYSQSPVCFGEISPVPPKLGKKRLKMIVEKNLKDISLLEIELSSLIAKGFGDTNLNALRQCRLKLESCYENIILDDPKYCAEKNPEEDLWKSCYHQIIEMLRRKLNENPIDEKGYQEMAIALIFKGTVFYENLMKKQQETYDFNLTRILEFKNMNVAHVPETIRIVLISTQKILIYLGDLARYKEQVNQTANYRKARSWYSKAQQTDPKNGRPYHQLANLAFIAGRKLDAVYYYIRSLAARNPILPAKESLLSLFEEAKKKYEQYEKERKEASVELAIFDENINERCEVWIKPDGAINQKHAEINENINSCRLKKLSDGELNRRFITSFLHVHGKLFTKVGMETFSDTLNHMLKEFYFLLQRSPLPITSSKLLRFVAINIFSVDNCSMEVHTSRSE